MPTNINAHSSIKSISTGSEANYCVCHSILQKGDEVAMMIPNYMQCWGVAEERLGPKWALRNLGGI